MGRSAGWRWHVAPLGIARTGNRFGMSATEQLNRTILLCRDYVSDVVSDDCICQGLQSVRVLCVADAANLSSHSGQSCLTTVVSLLSRIGMQVTLRIPEISMIRRQPPFRGTRLRDSLVASSGNLVCGATVQEETSKLEPDLVFVLGDSAIEEWSCPTWRLSGSEWQGAITQAAARAPQWAVEWPIGAMTSAVLAAGEAFKYVMRRFPLRSKDDRVFFNSGDAKAFSAADRILVVGNARLSHVKLRIRAKQVSTSICNLDLLLLGSQSKISKFQRIED